MRLVHQNSRSFRGVDSASLGEHTILSNAAPDRIHRAGTYAIGRPPGSPPMTDPPSASRSFFRNEHGLVSRMTRAIRCMPGL